MTWYRSIVKDGYTTRDPQDSNVEIAVWKVQERTYIKGSEPEGPEDAIKDWQGNLLYGKILDDALDQLGASEIARRTELKSYADDDGGRAASTIRGYNRNPDRLDRLKSSHPAKRVLRRYARSQDKGHFENDKAQDDGPDWRVPGTSGGYRGSKIDMAALKRAYKMARTIASENGLVFVDRSGTPEATEDNERIDRDEIRRHDRPTGEIHAACMVEKGGSIYEYEIDLDSRELDRSSDRTPPEGF